MDSVRTNLSLLALHRRLYTEAQFQASVAQKERALRESCKVGTATRHSPRLALCFVTQCVRLLIGWRKAAHERQREWHRRRVFHQAEPEGRGHHDPDGPALQLQIATRSQATRYAGIIHEAPIHALYIYLSLLQRSCMPSTLSAGRVSCPTIWRQGRVVTASQEQRVNLRL